MLWVGDCGDNPPIDVVGVEAEWLLWLGEQGPGCILCTSSRSSSLGTGNWIPFFLSSMYTSATPWSSGSWEKAWAQDWRSERTWRRAGNYWCCLPTRLTFVWISGPGSSCGEITRERRKSENMKYLRVFFSHFPLPLAQPFDPCKNSLFRK